MGSRCVSQVTQSIPHSNFVASVGRGTLTKRFLAPVGPPVRNASEAGNEHVRPDASFAISKLDNPSPFQDREKRHRRA